MLQKPKGFSTKYTYDTANVVAVAAKLSPIAQVPFIELTLDNAGIGIFTVALFPTANNVATVAAKLERAFGVPVSTPTGTDRKDLTRGIFAQIAGKTAQNVQVFQDPESLEIDLPWGEPKVVKKEQPVMVDCPF